MPRVATLDYENATPEAQALLDAITERYGLATNMKRTLAHSKPALDALTAWYPLRDAVVPFLGERLTALFCHAISAQSDCLLCTTYFRRALIEADADPSHLALDERAAAVVAFGRQLAADANQVSDELYARLAAQFTAQQLVTLTAFGALMIATNVFNSALRVELDEYLEEFRAG